MLTQPISPADAAQANYERFANPQLIIQKRMHWLYLTSLNYRPGQIAQILDLHRNSIRNYERLYQQQGLSALTQLHYRKPVSELDAHRSHLTTLLQQQPCCSSRQAAELIRQHTHLRRSPSRIRACLHRFGFRPRRTGHQPAKADPGCQQTFLEQTLQPLLNRCQQGQCHVFFMDSVHFLLAAVTSLVWCLQRLIIPAASGRFGLNVLGAVHAHTHEFTALYNASYINAEVVCEFLHQLVDQWADKPVFVVLDNARYQHCQRVKDLAAQLSVTLVFLPTYSPNLNLIERLWKLIKQEVVAGHYYESAQSFQQAILTYLHQLHTPSYSQRLKSLLAPNFQTFKCTKPNGS